MDRGSRIKSFQISIYYLPPAHRGPSALADAHGGRPSTIFIHILASSHPVTSSLVMARFLPQQGLMPDGTLAALLAYPQPTGTIADERCVELLELLGLGRLVPRLHEHGQWRQILSPGEQQRLAMARAILSDADFVFADEATSALDLHTEATCYSLLSERLPNTAIISIAHRPSVDAFHRTRFTISERSVSKSEITSSSDRELNVQEWINGSWQT